MNIYIGGAGAFGQYIGKQLMQKDISIDAFVDNYVSGTVLGINVIKPSEILEEDSSICIVAINNVYDRQNFIIDVISTGYEAIYIVDSNVFNAELNITDEEGEIEKGYLTHYADIKPIFPYIEYHLADTCNLNCKRCGHCANIASDPGFPSIEMFRENLSSLKCIFSDIGRFRLMGGEPLINKEYPEFVEAVSEVFPNANLSIVTNGLLLTMQKKEDIDRIRDKAVFQISQYPPTRKKMHEIISWANTMSISVQVSKPVEVFFASLSKNKDKDLEKVFANCISKNCYFMRDNYLLPCPFPWVAKKYGDYLGLPVTNEMFINNAVNLRDTTLDGWEILKKFYFKNEYCVYCSDNYSIHEWECGKGEENAADWYA